IRLLSANRGRLRYLLQRKKHRRKPELHVGRRFYFPKRQALHLLFLRKKSTFSNRRFFSQAHPSFLQLFLFVPSPTVQFRAILLQGFPILQVSSQFSSYPSFVLLSI